MADESKAEQESLLEATIRLPENVVHRSFEAETLLLNLETGQYHGLNETGGRMLELLETTGGRFRDSIAKLADEYRMSPEEIVPDLVAFCLELQARGLIEVEEP